MRKNREMDSVSAGVYWGSRMGGAKLNMVIGQSLRGFIVVRGEGSFGTGWPPCPFVFELETTSVLPGTVMF